MATLNFLANPGSVHVHQWIDLGAHAGQIDIYCIGEASTLKQDFNNIHIIAPLPAWAQRFPKFARYLLLGLWVRFRGPKSAKFHAHNSSGYGLAAAVSGRPYVLTTYGSEIFQSGKKGRLYKGVVRFALSRAVAITATAQKMAEVVQRDFGIPADKITTFSLGVPDPYFETASQSPRHKKNGHVWFYNRRILPLYNTLEVARAFKAFKAGGGRGRLILLKGDASGPYFESVENEAKGQADITLISEYLTQSKMIALLDQSDFTISIPQTDQLSSAILEGLARGKIPILRSIDSYSAISECCIFIDPEKPDSESLLEVFEKTASFSGSRMETLENCGKALAKSQYSKQSAVATYGQIIKQHLLSKIGE